MKKLIALLMAAMMILGLAACNDGTGSSPAAANDASAPVQESAAPADKDAGPVRIAFISPAMHYDFFAYLAAAAKKTAEENGAQIDVFDAKEDFTQVAEFISHAVAQKYDVICTAGFEPIIPAVAEANAAGIPLINFDARLMGPGDFYARVSSDNKELGKLDGEYVRGLIEQRTDKEHFVLMTVNFKDSQSNIDRCEGFAEAFAGMDNVEIKEVLPAAATVEGAQALFDDLLIGNPAGTIDYIFASSAGTGVGTMAAVTTAGRGEIGVVAVDDEQGLLDALLDPDSSFLATAAQNPSDIGRMTVEAALKAVEGEESGEVVVPGRLITKENVQKDIEEQAALKEELSKYK